MIVTNEGQSDQKTTVQSTGTRIRKFGAFIYGASAGKSNPNFKWMQKDFQTEVERITGHFVTEHTTDWGGLYATYIQSLAEFMLAYGGDDECRVWLVGAMTSLTIGE